MSQVRWVGLFAVVCVMLGVQAGPLRADDGKTASVIKVGEAIPLSAYRASILTLRDNAAAGIITPAQAEQGINRYLDQAEKSVGHTVTVKEVMEAADAAAVSAPQLTALQRAAGYVTFMNVLVVIGIAIGVLSFFILFGSAVVHLLKVFADIPLVVYEVIFYIGSGALLIYGHTLATDVAPYVGLVGCLLFGAALTFTAFNHKQLRKQPTYFSLILCLVWSVAAVVYGSSMIGFIAVAALMSALGFSVMAYPGMYVIGFNDEASVGRATSAAFMILALFFGIHVAQTQVSFLGVFERGSLWLGSFVGYLGLLICSSRWYDNKKSYVLFQIVTVLAGILALFLGSVFGVDELQKIGGTFFVLYLIEKVLEIPAKSKEGYAGVGLFASGLIFCIWMFGKNNPEIVAKYLLFLS